MDRWTDKETFRGTELQKSMNKLLMQFRIHLVNKVEDVGAEQKALALCQPHLQL